MLRLSVFEHLEVGRRQPNDRLTLLVEHGGVDFDDVDLGTKTWLRGLALRSRDEQCCRTHRKKNALGYVRLCRRWQLSWYVETL